MADTDERQGCRMQSTALARHGLPDALAECDLPHVHLKIGEGIVTRKALLISTVLGSCVSVTFFHRDLRLGGIFHAMLPSVGDSYSVQNDPCRYVDTAIEAVYGNFEKRGLNPSEVEVKLFGGAFSMGLKEEYPDRCVIDVGGRNVSRAREVLADKGLMIIGEQVQGSRGRKLLFNTATGEVWVKLLSNQANLQARKQEARARAENTISSE
ncbi:chemotaxis protein CheD [Oleidesulfovibrio sp.]|uniref:chemotaxis protein CheD n=1 Tax=Oleidesulfovibrio sp. TaxID=2909707 RepID=UPI003A8C0637